MGCLFLRKWGAVALLLLLGPVASAQFSPAETAQFQRQLRATRFDHQFWDASPDSLFRVVASRRADTLRLHALEHLLYLGYLTPTTVGKALALATKLKMPSRKPLHQLAAAMQLADTKPPALAAARDSLQKAAALFEALGPVPYPTLLSFIRDCYNQLNQPEAKRAYFQQRLAYYQQHGPKENIATCYRVLGGYYEGRGDYNQGISYRLRAAELFRSFSNFWYYNEIGVIGASYVDWGNSARGLPYLKQAAAAKGRAAALNWVFLNRAIARIYYQQGRYPLALRYATLALRPRTPRDTVFADDQALGLVPKSAALLALGRTAEARPLLERAQHLADSLHLPLYSSGGDLELPATWARYYAATGDYPRAEAAWHTAYRQASQEHRDALRLAYLHALAGFYQQRGRPAQAAPYALAALGLADTLNTAQAATRVAQYELTQADRAQTARIAGLREAQAQAASRARRQRWLLGAVLTVLALIGGLVYVLWRSNRRQQQANAALKRLNEAVTAQKTELQAQRDQLDHSLTELRATQQQLIQKEKMASLGELTAGIAHEIQNPLNFVNNFAEVSHELIDELTEEQQRPVRDLALETELLTDLRQNLQKINQHGQRAAGIVRSMLEHSRQSTGERLPTDVNALCDEYLRLAYHGLRAKDKTFNAELKPDLAPASPLVEAVPGDLGRVLLNLFTNAFYAVQKRQQSGEPGYQPTVGVRTRLAGPVLEISVSDNGTGIPEAVRQKIFQPFFTTKPTGEGTGLGLSLAHDIITQGHGGTLAVASQPGQGTTFTVRLPLALA